MRPRHGANIQAISFISSKDATEERLMHEKSSNTKLMIHDNVNDVVDEPSSHFFQDVKIIQKLYELSKLHEYFMNYLKSLEIDCFNSFN